MGVTFHELILATCPKLKGVDLWIPHLQKVALDGDHFNLWFANVVHETQGLTRLQENLNYKSSERLLKVFPRAFKSVAEAAPYVGKPKELSALLYNRFHGRGLLHLTWEEDYKKCSKALGMDFVKDPDLLLQPEWAVNSAAWFWCFKKIGAKVEAAGDDDLARCNAATKAINGKAMLGASDRYDLFVRIQNLRQV